MQLNKEKIMDKQFAQYSKFDSRGMPVIDCSECERGGNGSDKDLIVFQMPKQDGI